MDNLEDKERLIHIKKAIVKIEKFTEDIEFSAFIENEMLQDAIFKNLEIIGEAAYKVSNKMKSKHNNIEWRKIEGLRHKLVHDYYQVDLEIVWETKNKSLPDLEHKIDLILERYNS